MSRARDFADLASAYSGGALGKRNMIINGNMAVSQRATSATGLGASEEYVALDRMLVSPGSAATAGRFTMTQTADGPSGIANCLKLACTTADTSIAASEKLGIVYVFEGQDVQRLKKGTSDAEAITLSFYVKGNTSATYVCELVDLDNTRHIAKTFAVTTSWNRIELTFAGDTTGALDDDNAGSLQITFWLHGGSTYTGGTLPSSWASTSNANRAGGLSTSFYDATSRTFFLTGLQMEVGEVATAFEHESYGDNLQRCQRYFYKFLSTNVYGALGATGMQINTNATSGVMFQGTHPVMMRAAPTMAIGGSWSAEAATGSTTFELAESVRTNIYTWQSQEAIPSSNASDGAAAMAYAENRADAFLSGSAELS